MAKQRNLFKIGIMTKERQAIHLRDSELLAQHPHARRVVRAPYEGEFSPEKGYQSVLLTRLSGGKFVITPIYEPVSVVQSYIDQGILKTPYTDALIEADKKRGGGGSWYSNRTQNMRG